MAKAKQTSDPVLIMARALAERTKSLCSTLEGQMPRGTLRGGIKQVRTCIDALVDGYEKAIKSAGNGGK